MHKYRQHLYIGICGAPSTGKTALLNALKKRAAHYRLRFVDIRHCARAVAERAAYKLNSQGSRESQFAIDAEQMTREEKLAHQHKITSRTIIDAYAHAKANKLNLEAYYQTLMSKVSKYSLILYIPIEPYVPFVSREGRNKEYQQRVDKSIKKIIKAHHIPVQVVSGNLDMRARLGWAAINLLR